MKANKTTVPPIIPEEFYSLEGMTKDEVEALCAVLERVGGDCRYSQRKHIGKILDALVSVGITYDQNKNKNIEGSLKFLSYVD